MVSTYKSNWYEHEIPFYVSSTHQNKGHKTIVTKSQQKDSFYYTKVNKLLVALIRALQDTRQPLKYSYKQASILYLISLYLETVL